MRRVQPATKKSAPRYPTLRVAWKILAATMPLLPSVAHADATVPGEKRPCPKPEPGETGPTPPLGGAPPAPKPPGTQRPPKQAGGNELPPTPAGKKAGPNVTADDLLIRPDFSK